VRADLRDLPSRRPGRIPRRGAPGGPLQRSPGSLNPELTHAINYQASVLLASNAKAAGVSRFVFASSCSLYGAAGSEPGGGGCSPEAPDALRRLEGGGGEGSGGHGRRLLQPHLPPCGHGLWCVTQAQG
jgi:hypothetical protein